jgi:hypothetical protein
MGKFIGLWPNPSFVDKWISYSLSLRCRDNSHSLHVGELFLSLCSSQKNIEIKSFTLTHILWAYKDYILIIGIHSLTHQRKFLHFQFGFASPIFD